MVASRTPEGAPNRCPLCGSMICVEPSQSTGDAPCPNCGQLVWFTVDKLGAERARQLMELLRDRLKSDIRKLSPLTPLGEIGADSLDLVELHMELEEEFDVAIPEEQAENIKTIGDVIDAIERRRRKEP